MTGPELEARLAEVHRLDASGDHESAHVAEDALVADVLADVVHRRREALARAAALLAHLRSPHRGPRWMA